MSEHFYITAEQLERIRPYFPLSHGVARVDDRKVISGIIYVIKNGLMWKDAPTEYGPYKTLYNRFIRWSNLGVFSKIFSESPDHPFKGWFGRAPYKGAYCLQRLKAQIGFASRLLLLP